MQSHTPAYIKMYLGKFLNCSDKCILSTVQTRATGDFDESDRSEKVIQTNQLNFVRTELLDNEDIYVIIIFLIKADLCIRVTFMQNNARKFFVI